MGRCTRMSLKSKIEAVIYASEEPVTLTQLVVLLSEEAQSELDDLAARQAELPLGQDAEGAHPPGEAANVTADAADTDDLEGTIVHGHTTVVTAADLTSAEAEEPTAANEDQASDSAAAGGASVAPEAELADGPERSGDPPAAHALPPELVHYVLTLIAMSDALLARESIKKQMAVIIDDLEQKVSCSVSFNFQHCLTYQYSWRVSCK